MKNFIEKLIERLERSLEANSGWDDDDYFRGENSAYEDAIEIINKLAEKYKVGWIPCSKELPPQPKSNLLFENKPLELYLATVKGSDYAWRVFWNGECFTDGWSKVDVIAWQPLPEPYKTECER